MRTTSPYKTAEELKIEQWEHDGLVALIGPLSRGEFGFDMRRTYKEWSTPGPSYAFPNRVSECGSVGCIGGNLAARVGITKVNAYVNSKKIKGSGIRKLYFPDESTGRFHPGWRSSPQQASVAVVNFLTLGDPKWDDVMREPDIADFDADDSGAVLHVLTEDA